MSSNKIIALLLISSILLNSVTARNCVVQCQEKCGKNDAAFCAMISGAGGAALGAHAGIAAMGTAIAATGPLAIIGLLVGGAVCNNSHQTCINDCLVNCVN